jgi:thiamine-monophosphate kinase
MPETLGSLGEGELLRRLARFAPPGQLDDDAALLASRSGQELVVNTDVLVDGVHFSDRTVDATSVGWRVVAANLSDLAGMGCLGVEGVTIGLVAPAETPWSWVASVYGGVNEALNRYGGHLLGGDCSGGRQRVLAVTALGWLPAGRGIHRSHARPGDWVISSGIHGLSRLGLALLQGEIGPGRLDAGLEARAIGAHRRPRARCDIPRALHRCRPDQRPWRVGGLDSSDGLLAALTEMARSSCCQVVLDEDGLPLDPGTAHLDQARRWCLEGGEDYELVLSLPPDWARGLMRRQADCRRIGHVREMQGQPGSVVSSRDGRMIEASGRGFRHFAAED